MNLEEYRYRLISEMVLGMNHDKLTPCKYKWISNIPANWNICKINSSCSIKGRIGWQGLTSDEYQNEGPYLITGTDFDNGIINWHTCVHITNSRYEEAAPIRVKENDLLITKDGTVGKVALVKNLNGKASLNSGVLMIRNIKNDYYNKYLFYVLKSSVFWEWFKEKQKGNSTIIHLYQEQFEKFVFPKPPLNEQITIADYLDNKCGRIDDLIKIKREKIELLKLYKKSIINELVTGKKEVPHA